MSNEISILGQDGLRRVVQDTRERVELAKVYPDLVYFPTATVQSSGILLSITTSAITEITKGMCLTLELPSLNAEEITALSVNYVPVQLSINGQVYSLKTPNLDNFPVTSARDKTVADSADTYPLVAGVWDDHTNIRVYFDGTQWRMCENTVLRSYTTVAANDIAHMGSYRIYADGIKECWGTYDPDSSERNLKNISIVLPVVYKSRGYISQATPLAASAQTNYAGAVGLRAQTETDFQFCYYGYAETDKSRWIKWRTIGV